MAILTYTCAYGDWSGTMNLSYTVSYNASANTTTITFLECNATYSSRYDYSTTTDTNITVAAGDNSGSSGTTTLHTSGYGTGGPVTFVGTPSPASITVQHASGSSSKTVNISASTTVAVRPYSNSDLAYAGGKGSISVVSGTPSTTVTATAQAYSGGKTTSSKWIGYSYSTVRTVRYQFTTNSNGATSISFSFQGPTNPSGNSTAASINWYVTTSSTSHASAGASATKNGTCSASYNSSTYAWTISVSNGAVKLLPNTTYYLWLFPNHSSSNHYLTINSSWATNMSITLGGSYKPCTLTFSKGTGTNLEVTKDGSTISSGTTVYTGDIIKVWYNASTGYTNAMCSVSGVGSISNGGTFTVTTNHTITTSASVLSYFLSISAGTGSTITVNRTSSPLKGASTGNLSNNAIIYYNDVLKITFGASTGYNLGTHTVNNSAFTSENSHTVTGAVAVVSTATVKSYSLTTSAGTGSTITVNRTSSPLKGAATGTISSGDTIYYNDVLKITFKANTGYNISTHTVNNSAFTSNNSHTVTANVSIVSTATVKSYTLNISAGNGSSITVNRTSSPKKGANTGSLSDGATIYYSDVLKITFDASLGYKIDTHTVNDSVFTSGDSHTVKSAVSIVATASLNGIAHLYANSEYVSGLCWIYTNGQWYSCIPYLYSGGKWNICV